MTDDKPEIEMIALDDLVPFERNPRRITERGLAKIASSIKSFGFVAPVIAQRGTNVIIAGHQRVKAARDAGVEKAPVVFVDLSDEEAVAYNIADNRLGQEATWDDELLATLLDEMNELDRKLVGFDDIELRRRLQPEEAPDSEMAEVWGIIIVCADEDEQLRFIAEFQERGVECRALMS